MAWRSARTVLLDKWVLYQQSKLAKLLFTCALHAQAAENEARMAAAARSQIERALAGQANRKR